MKNRREDFFEVVAFILNHPEFQRRKTFKHHGEETVYDHSLKVAYYSYVLARLLHVDAETTAIAGLLHDFYTTPWMDDPVKHKKIRDLHGFAHPKIAYENTKKYFPQVVDPKVRDVIVKHMFPFTILPPIYIEGWIVTFVDKYVSLTVFKDVKNLPKYVGIKGKRKEK